MAWSHFDVLGVIVTAAESRRRMYRIVQHFDPRQRLLNLTRDRKEDFGLLLTKYTLERLLFRISKSDQKTAFLLKRALLFELLTEETHRPRERPYALDPSSGARKGIDSKLGLVAGAGFEPGIFGL